MLLAAEAIHEVNEIASRDFFWKAWVRHFCIRQVLGSRPGWELFVGLLNKVRPKERVFVCPSRGAHLIHSTTAAERVARQEVLRRSGGPV